MRAPRNRLIGALSTYRSLVADAVEAPPGDAPSTVGWEGPIVFEGQVTGDGRMIDLGALTWPDDLGADNPLAWRFVGEDVGFHDGAVVTGHIFSLERRDGGAIWATGDYVLDSDAARTAYAMAVDRRQAGISVDLDDISFEVRVRSDLVDAEEEDGVALLLAAGGDPTADGGYEKVFEAKSDDEIMVTTSARIRGATQVSIPAFDGARVEILHDVATAVAVPTDAAPAAVAATATMAADPDAEAEVATGAIVALLPAKDDPIVAASSQIAHVTMAYLGEAADLADDVVAAIRAQVTELASASSPATAAPGERTTLGDSEADVVMLSGSDLTDLRDALAAKGSAVADAIAAEAFPFNPHITLGYPDNPAKADYNPADHDEVTFDRLAVWIGEDRTEYPLGAAADAGGGDAAPADPAASLEAAAAPLAPPRAWFADPKLDGPTPLRVDEHGRVFGHLAAWGVCHIASPAGEGVCVEAPHSAMGYARFHTGTLQTSDGSVIDVGRLTMGTGHAGPRANGAAAAAHYDHTGMAVADVRAGEDAFGIWVAGALRPEVTPEQIRTLRASPLSGDWRRDESTGSLELRAALAVNVPGFPIPRPAGMVASGALESLVASGVVIGDETVDKFTEPGSPFSAADLAYLERLIARERNTERDALRARVDASRAAFARRKVAAFVAARKKGL